MPPSLSLDIALALAHAHTSCTCRSFVSTAVHVLIVPIQLHMNTQSGSSHAHAHALTHTFFLWKLPRSLSSSLVPVVVSSLVALHPLPAWGEGTLGWWARLLPADVPIGIGERWTRALRGGGHCWVLLHSFIQLVLKDEWRASLF